MKSFKTLAAISLLVTASVAMAGADDAPTDTPIHASDASDAMQSAWSQRTLHDFGIGFTSCDLLNDRLRSLLRQLGARERDMKFDQRECTSNSITNARLDVSFSVLVPSGSAPKEAAAESLPAHWQLVELHASELGTTKNCAIFENITRIVLPLFTTRDVKLIPRKVCATYDIGLRAEVLMPTLKPAHPP